jgi:hypothetical protein
MGKQAKQRALFLQPSCNLIPTATAPLIPSRQGLSVQLDRGRKMTDPSIPDYRELADIHDRQFQRFSIDNRIYFVPVDEVRT